MGDCDESVCESCVKGVSVKAFPCDDAEKDRVDR